MACTAKKKLGNQKKLEDYDPLYQEARRKAKREFIGGHMFIFLILLLIVMVTVSMFSDAPLAQKTFEKLDPGQQEAAKNNALLTKLTGTLIGLSDERVAENNQGKVDHPTPLPSTTQLLEGVGYLLILLAVIIGLFTYASVSVRVEEAVDSRKVVINYIQLARQQGFSKQQIKDRLVHEGHEMGEVEGLMSEGKGDGDDSSDLQVSLKVN